MNPLFKRSIMSKTNIMNPLFKRSIMKAVEKKYNGCTKLVAFIDIKAMEITTDKNSKLEPIDYVNFENIKTMFNLNTLHKITIDVMKNVIILHGDKEIVL